MWLSFLLQTSAWPWLSLREKLSELVFSFTFKFIFSLGEGFNFQWITGSCSGDSETFKPTWVDSESSPPLSSSPRLQATWTSRWWMCPSCSAPSPSSRAWSSTATACTIEWRRRSPWDSSSGTCKCEHTHTHRGFTHSDMSRGGAGQRSEWSGWMSKMLEICHRIWLVALF